MLPVLAPKQGNSQVVAFGNVLPNATGGNPSLTDDRSFPQAVAPGPRPRSRRLTNGLGNQRSGKEIAGWIAGMIGILF
jgi:hypothetical protein